jgi:oxygen-independent coproporphyrinogen III oxidase
MQLAVEAIARRFTADKDDLEITLEANPTDVTDDSLREWRKLGINRLSIGVQSLAQEDLVVLGRDHRFGDGKAAVDRAQAHGGFAVTADFILGVPPRKQLPEFLTSCDHLSVYELTIEERTAFGQRAKAGRFTPLDQDTLTDLYIGAHEKLTAAGFEHYEISSYARPGKRAVHNSLYWRGAPYLGLGVGAASLWLAPDGSAVRQTNPRRWADYVKQPGEPAERVDVGAREMRVDRLWLGMRTADGVAEEDLPAGIASWLVDEGLAERRAGNICPTLRGFLMADGIAARIVQAL